MPGARGFPAEEHVVGDRQRRRQSQRLIHGLDARFARRRSASVKWTTSPPSRISPESGMTAPQSALISVDLPAPLSPMTARISPG